MSDTEAADEDKVETEEERNNGESKGGGGGDASDGDLSDVEALVMQEAEQEIAVEERIRDAYRTAAEAEAEAGNLKAAAKPASVQEIVYCEGEEGKVTEIQGGNSIEGKFF